MQHAHHSSHTSSTPSTHLPNPPQALQQQSHQPHSSLLQEQAAYRSVIAKAASEEIRKQYGVPDVPITFGVHDPETTIPARHAELSKQLVEQLHAMQTAGLHHDGVLYTVPTSEGNSSSSTLQYTFPPPNPALSGVQQEGAGVRMSPIWDDKGGVFISTRVVRHWFGTFGQQEPVYCDLAANDLGVESSRRHGNGTWQSPSKACVDVTCAPTAAAVCALRGAAAMPESVSESDS